MVESMNIGDQYYPGWSILVDRHDRHRHRRHQIGFTGIRMPGLAQIAHVDAIDACSSSFLRDSQY